MFYICVKMFFLINFENKIFRINFIYFLNLVGFNILNICYNLIEIDLYVFLMWLKLNKDIIFYGFFVYEKWFFYINV